MSELVLGIDDAGRGPVIGPMILAGCLLTKDQERELKKLGVKDSKDLTPKRRELLADKIKGIATSFQVEAATPEQIDSNLETDTNLNQLEAILIAKIINEIGKKFGKIKVIIDCPSISILKWKDYLKTKLENLKDLEIVCEHKADKNHIQVGAASILAKSRRENEMDKLKEKYGNEMGSGYTSDPNTQKFLKKYVEKYAKEGIFRKSWKTYKEAAIKNQQKTLF